MSVVPGGRHLVRHRFRRRAAVGLVEEPVKDQTARALAKHAIKLAIGDRPAMFHGKCALCGMPCRGRYCHSHDWMYGNQTEGAGTTLDGRSADTLNGGEV